MEAVRHVATPFPTMRSEPKRIHEDLENFNPNLKLEEEDLKKRKTDADANFKIPPTTSKLKQQQQEEEEIDLEAESDGEDEYDSDEYISDDSVGDSEDEDDEEEDPQNKEDDEDEEDDPSFENNADSVNEEKEALAVAQEKGLTSTDEAISHIKEHRYEQKIADDLLGIVKSHDSELVTAYEKLSEGIRKANRQLDAGTAKLVQEMGLPVTVSEESYFCADVRAIISSTVSALIGSMVSQRSSEEEENEEVVEDEEISVDDEKKENEVNNKEKEVERSDLQEEIKSIRYEVEEVLQVAKSLGLNVYWHTLRNDYGDDDKDYEVDDESEEEEDEDDDDDDDEKEEKKESAPEELSEEDKIRLEALNKEVLEFEDNDDEEDEEEEDDDEEDEEEEGKELKLEEDEEVPLVYDTTTIHGLIENALERESISKSELTVEAKEVIQTVIESILARLISKYVDLSKEAATKERLIQLYHKTYSQL